MSWLRTALLLLLTGGVRSPLLSLREGELYHVVRRGGRLHLDRPAQPTIAPSSGRRFERGQRVVALDHAGFHRGARGAVMFQEPAGGPACKVWVLRDGASSEVFYYDHELAADGEAEEPA